MYFCKKDDVINSKILLVVLFILFSCSSSKKLLDKTDIEDLFLLMSGSFDSEDQSKSDSSYYNISLHMYPIWKNKKGYWLYVEQALKSMQDKPYRQRVYKIENIENNIFLSSVYTLQNESDFIGKWKDPLFFDDFSESILEERQGCSVFLEKLAKNKYAGRTKDKECKSSLRGATYATSIVTIEKDKITSWDQGFNDLDEQVWGATEGPYIFKKIKNE